MTLWTMSIESIARNTSEMGYRTHRKILSAILTRWHNDRWDPSTAVVWLSLNEGLRAVARGTFSKRQWIGGAGGGTLDLPRIERDGGSCRRVKYVPLTFSGSLRQSNFTSAAKRDISLSQALEDDFRSRRWLGGPKGRYDPGERKAGLMHPHRGL